MQDPQSILGLPGRIFSGGGGGGGVERRGLRGYGHPQAGSGAAPAVVKCPRCDSANTKFCYYNNYNLSQPRHFCKSCRRYWTRGGVLRNVPVGGGCRKPSSSKRSSSSTASSSSSKKPSAADKECRRPASSHSSSDSSTLTASTSDPVLLSNSNPNMSASRAPIRASEPLPESTSFTSLVAADPASVGCFGFSGLPQIGGAAGGIDDRTAAFVDETAAGGGGRAFNGLDWAAPMVDPSIFDLPSAVDHGVFWNPSQGPWGDVDPSLYLP